MDLTPERLRNAFAAYPSGVTAIAGMVDDAPVGMAASSFTSVSLDPPLVSVCIARTSATWPVLRRSERIGVSVLAAGHGDIARALAAKSGDRFGNLDWEAAPGGAVFVQGSALWISCTLSSALPAGDHEIALLHIHELQVFPGVQPLIFHDSTYRQLAHAEGS
jgi:flavin reductase (DIM6/NTAB) family NADH-FMN oxidoreductase RutF